MGAIVIRNLPDEVHIALRRLATQQNVSLEAFVRETLADVARRKPGGIDFERLTRARAALGLYEDGPAWTSELDDPKLSFEVLGLKKQKKRSRRKK
jgi:hypothetical protein